MDFKEVILGKIREKEASGKKHVKSGKFSPSRMGRCFRYQIMQQQKIEESDPISQQLAMTFEIGTIVHRYLQSFLDKERCEVNFDVSGFGGFCDYVGEDFVVDFKTTGFFQWKRIEKMTDESIQISNEQYCYQLMTYAYFLGKSKGYLIFVKKDDMSMKQFEIDLSDWKDRIETEIKVLTDYRESGKVPKGIPRAYGGKECNYCGYKSICPDYAIPTKGTKKGGRNGKSVF